MKHRQRAVLILASVVLVGASGCVSSAVRQIVAETNAAMASPYVQGVGDSDPGGWQEAIAQIDRLIAANPGEAVLVNHLRLRQAMLLSVQKKPNLARERWALIEREKLKNERDRALYDTSESLLWAYNRNTEFSDAKAREQIDTALTDVQGREIRIYLRMVQANVTLKEANALDDDRDKPKINELLGETLNTFVGEFSDAERAWAKTNFAGGPPSQEELSLLDVRHRVWLRRVVKGYQTEATTVGVTPDWSSDVKSIMGDSSGP